MDLHPDTRKLMSVAAVVVWLLLLCSHSGAASEHLAETADGFGEPQVFQPRQKRSDDVDPLESVVAQLSQKVSTLDAQLQATEAELQATKTELQNSKGSTFVRWGRTSCPAGSVMVYSGVVGGENFNHGGASNRLCLTMNPLFDNTQVLSGSYPSHLYGAEYFVMENLDSLDVVCAVCSTAHPATIMVPGTSACPSGWTVQYSGHLTAGYGGDGSAEYLCLDGQPQYRNNPHRDFGALFHYTVAACGSLPCPPYINNRVVTCAVCSK